MKILTTLLMVMIFCSPEIKVLDGRVIPKAPIHSQNVDLWSLAEKAFKNVPLHRTVAPGENFLQTVGLQRHPTPHRYSPDGNKNSYPVKKLVESLPAVLTAVRAQNIESCDEASDDSITTDKLFPFDQEVSVKDMEDDREKSVMTNSNTSSVLEAIDPRAKKNGIQIRPMYSLPATKNHGRKPGRPVAEGCLSFVHTPCPGEKQPGDSMEIIGISMHSMKLTLGNVSYTKNNQCSNQSNDEAQSQGINHSDLANFAPGTRGNSILGSNDDHHDDSDHRDRHDYHGRLHSVDLDDYYDYYDKTTRRRRIRPHFSTKCPTTCSTTPSTCSTTPSTCSTTSTACSTTTTTCSTTTCSTTTTCPTTTTTCSTTCPTCPTTCSTCPTCPTTCSTEKTCPTTCSTKKTCPTTCSTICPTTRCCPLTPYGSCCTTYPMPYGYITPSVLQQWPVQSTEYTTQFPQFMPMMPNCSNGSCVTCLFPSLMTEVVPLTTPPNGALPRFDMYPNMMNESSWQAGANFNIQAQFGNTKGTNVTNAPSDEAMHIRRGDGDIIAGNENAGNQTGTGKFGFNKKGANLNAKSANTSFIAAPVGKPVGSVKGVPNKSSGKKIGSYGILTDKSAFHPDHTGEYKSEDKGGISVFKLLISGPTNNSKAFLVPVNAVAGDLPKLTGFTLLNGIIEGDSSNGDTEKHLMIPEYIVHNAQNKKVANRSVIKSKSRRGSTGFRKDDVEEDDDYDGEVYKSVKEKRFGIQFHDNKHKEDPIKDTSYDNEIFDGDYGDDNA